MGAALARRNAGFSLFELVMAMGILVGVTAVLFGAMRAARGVFAVQPEAVDAQQRLRVAADMLTKDLAMAGAGASFGALSGGLVRYFAPVLPYRRGAIGGDPPGTFRSDAITLFYLASGSVQSTTSADTTSATNTILLNSDPGCPLARPACGFAPGDTALLYDGAGNFDGFTVTSVAGNALGVEPNAAVGGAPTAYAQGARIVSAVERTYFLEADASRNHYRLESYEGGTNADIPVVDHVVGLRFEYYAGDQVPLTAAQLTDGPWRPDAASPHRYDADLLRVRTIAVTLRLEIANDAMRGPAGPLFTRGGTAVDPRLFLPDQEVRFEVSPRNLGLGP